VGRDSHHDGCPTGHTGERRRKMEPKYIELIQEIESPSGKVYRKELWEDANGRYYEVTRDKTQGVWKRFELNEDC